MWQILCANINYYKICFMYAVLLLEFVRIVIQLWSRFQSDVFLEKNFLQKQCPVVAFGMLSYIGVSGFDTWLQIPANVNSGRQWLKWLGSCHLHWQMWIEFAALNFCLGPGPAPVVSDRSMCFLCILK